MASNFKFGVEPFEEFQDSCEPSATSPDALGDLVHMEHQEVTGRKLSRDQSTSKRSLWFRKSTKRQKGAPVTTTLGKLTTPMEPDSPLEKKGEDDNDGSDDQRGGNDQLASSVSRSIIPDPLGELPAWFSKENDLAVGQTVSYRIKYPIHSPVGPRWYKNQHLIPSSQLRPANRPPSVFSPSFPPMASTHDPSEDSVTKPGLSRSPSGSPMATPDSSQGDVAAKPRGRKTSQTTPDNVDLLDITDPWGTHYHHPSPYDPGLTSSPVISAVADAPENPVSPRSRHSSMTGGQTRHRTVTPSPLSQSTSALHLQPPDTGSQHAGRKLSKNRKPLMDTLFGGGQDKQTEDLVPRAAPAPATPVEPLLPARSSTVPNGLHLGGDKRNSTLQTPLSSHLSAPTMTTHMFGEKKGKRGSVLGRLAKKLSIMKRPTYEPGRGSVGSISSWQHVGTGDAQSRNSRQSTAFSRPSLQENPSTDSRKTDPIKRVPAPAPEPESLVGGPTTGGLPRQSGDHKSCISLEPPLSMGKLTVANPDIPNSAENTPVAPNIPLPPDVSPAPEATPRPKMSTRDSQERPKSSLPPLPDPAPVQEQAAATPPKSSSPPAALSPEGTPTLQRRPSPSEIPQSPATTDPMSLYPMYVNNLPSSPVIPFPTLDQRPASAISASTRATIASSPASFTNDSPLSRASLIVNPPTPYTPPAAMTPPPAAPAHQATPDRPSHNGSSSKGSQTKPKAEPKPKAEVAKPKAEVTKPKVEVAKAKVEAESKDEGQRGASPVTSRQTEKFKLIRSPSGNAIPTNETFTAGGEQWEVVESSDPSKKSKNSSRSKDRDAGGRRDQKRQEPSILHEVEDHHRVSGREKSFHGKAGDQSAAALVPEPPRPTRAHSMETPHRAGQEVTKQNRKDPNLNKPQPPPPPPTPGPSWLDRQPSTSTRPTSELPSSAELNALRAREAWAMDRLWKGTSMHSAGHPEPNGPIAAPSHLHDSRKASAHTDLARDNSSVVSAGHGSSHTSFMVQPFQGQASSNMYYSNMPSAPPPVIYSPTTQPQAPFPSVPYDYSSYRSLHPSFSFSSPDLSPEPTSRPNPLPPPPRESSYQPSPLPPLVDGRPTSDRWTIHPSVTTAH